MTFRFLFLALFAINLAFVCAQPRSRQAFAIQTTVSGSTKPATQTKQAQPFKPPAEIVLVLAVAELPGITNPKSFWEGAYEIRLAEWNAIAARPVLADAADLGESFVQSSFARRSFLAEDDRHITISLPVTGPLLQRLERETNHPQVFLLRSTIRLFDAKLDRQFVLKVNRLWRFKLFPDGRATVTIKVAPDGSYSTWGPVPKTLPVGYSIVGLPANPPPAKTP